MTTANDSREVLSTPTARCWRCRGRGVLRSARTDAVLASPCPTCSGTGDPERTVPDRDRLARQDLGLPEPVACTCPTWALPYVADKGHTLWCDL